MIDAIINASAIPFRPGRFPDPPEETYGVWFDAITADGPDDEAPLVFTHDVTMELYAPTIDVAQASQNAFETAINAQGIPWTTQGWYWLENIQRYQSVYEFTYTTKN